MKRLILLFLSLVTVIMFSSCSNYIKELEARVTELESENAELKEQLSPAAEGEEANASENAIPEIFIGEPFICGDVMELTLDSVSWCEEIYPSSPEYLSYIGDNEGEKFLAIRGRFTNTASISVDLENVSDIYFTVNGEYRQKGAVVIENANKTNFLGIAKPLQTLDMVIYLSVSEALYERCESLSMELKLVNNNEQLEYFYEDGFATDDFILNLTSADIEELK